MLQELGYADIRHVDEVNAALLSVARAAPDVALLDAQLKGVVSYRVAGELAERGIPFVVGTSFDPASLPAEFQRGVPLRKPYTLPLLAQALADAFATRA